MSDQFKADVAALARRLGVTAPQLFGWRKAHLDRQGEAMPLSSTDRPPVIELVVGDLTLLLVPDVSQAALRKILRVLRQA